MISLLRLAALALCATGAFAVQAHAACKLDKFAALPVTMTDLRPLVAVKINDVDAVFLADSGAFYSQMSAAKAAEFGLRPGPAPYGLTVSGIGGEESVKLASVRHFTVAGATLTNKEFLVGGSELGNESAGLIGQNILGYADTDYDLANGVINLIAPRDCGNRELAYWSPTLPSTLDLLEEGQIFPTAKSTAYINGVRVRVLFDTGAWKSILSLDAAKRAGIDIKGPGVTPAGLTGGIGRRRVESWIAPVDVFKIGDEEVKHTRLRVAATTIDGVDMLLGADFFLSHHVYIAKSQRKIYFTYNGGPVFNLSTTAPALPTLTPASATADTTAAPKALPDPTDAEGFARRGAAFTDRRDFDHAIADLTRAVTLAPTEPRYLFERARAYEDNHQPFLAMADLNQGLKLNPGDIAGLVMRARLEFSGHDKIHALADLDAVDRLAAKQADVRLNLAELYASYEAYTPALAQLDLWIAAHPDDSHQAQALNDRCWSRAITGQDLHKALVDCNAALGLTPKTPAYLNSRGLVRLRQGDLDKAIADYDAALAGQPKYAWALYGRGLAKLKKGLTAEGNADIAAAVALRPGLPAQAKTYGLAPSVAG
jgi:tetratricopeptide (TPR) repeat protein/predicted aspartyl protease